MRYQQEITRVLSEKRHLRVEEIFGILKAAHPRMSMATVYRNLKQLQKAKEVAGFLHPDSSIRYELRAQPPHQHLVCDACGIVIEITLGFIEELAGNLKEKANFHLHPHSLAIIGQCVVCP